MCGKCPEVTSHVVDEGVDKLFSDYTVIVEQHHSWYFTGPASYDNSAEECSQCRSIAAGYMASEERRVFFVCG